MKILCGTIGILFVFLANFLPLPDPGLPTALLVCGGSLCISALALELHPFIALIADEADFAHFHPQQKQPQSLEEATPVSD